MPVGFDSNILSILLNPTSRIPLDPATNRPIELAKERVEGLLAKLQKERQTIIIPAPVTAEILTVLGPTSADYLRVINKSRVFEVRAFDEICAIELAFINRDIFGELDSKDKSLEPWQKVKIDRQILSICRVANCETLYTDDKSLINRAKLCGLPTIRASELPIPDAARQGKLDLEQNEELAEIEDDEPDITIEPEDES